MMVARAVSVQTYGSIWFTLYTYLLKGVPVDRSGFQPSFEDVQQQLEKLREHAQEDMRQQGVAEEDINSACRAFDAAADEWIQGTDWEHAERWRRESLQRKYWNRTDLGNAFFDELEARRTTQKNVPETFYYSLVLGFHGQYDPRKDHATLESLCLKLARGFPMPIAEVESLDVLTPTALGDSPEKPERLMWLRRYLKALTVLCLALPLMTLLGLWLVKPPPPLDLPIQMAVQEPAGCQHIPMIVGRFPPIFCDIVEFFAALQAEKAQDSVSIHLNKESERPRYTSGEFFNGTFTTPKTAVTYGYVHYFTNDNKVVSLLPSQKVRDNVFSPNSQGALAYPGVPQLIELTCPCGPQLLTFVACESPLKVLPGPDQAVQPFWERFKAELRQSSCSVAYRFITVGDRQ